MAKLRKMLGRADDPQIVTLMGLIETQSPSTLAAWATDWVQKRYLPVYRARFPEDTRLEELLDAVQATLAGRLPRAQLRAALRQARTVPLEAEGEAAAQAAARAVVTACSVLQTPTSALGFVFYGAAAAAYSAAGTSAAPAEYDALASAEFDSLVQSLRQVMVPNEPNPAKINWNC